MYDIRRRTEDQMNKVTINTLKYRQTPQQEYLVQSGDVFPISARCIFHQMCEMPHFLFQYNLPGINHPTCENVRIIHPRRASILNCTKALELPATISSFKCQGFFHCSIWECKTSWNLHHHVNMMIEFTLLPWVPPTQSITKANSIHVILSHAK